MSSRFDRHVWICLQKSCDSYDYICTQVNDFKVAARDPKFWVERIADDFLVKEHGPQNYHSGEDKWTYRC